MQSISTAWKTDKGPRSANEDSCVVLTRDDLNGKADVLLVLADGMGGRASGATASGIAVDAVARVFASAVRAGDAGDLGGVLSKGIEAANSAVIQAATARPELQGMGTTCVAAAVKDDRLDVAHVGDSRAYLLRNGRPLRLTEDHSIVAEKVRSGEMTEEEARRSRFRNVITRAVGLEEGIAPEVNGIGLKAGDVIVLCSDGLTGPLRESEISDIVGSSADPEEACERLVAAALKSGGSDNVTVALAAYGRTSARVSSRAPLGIVSKLARVLVPGLIGLIIGTALGLYAEKIPYLKMLHPERKVVVPAPEPDMSKLEYGIPASLLYTPLRGDVLLLSKDRLTVLEKGGALRLVDKTGRMVPGFTDDLTGESRVLSGTRDADRQGNVYISDRKNKCILRFDAEGNSLKTIGEGQLVGPEALVVDKNGDIYVIDGGRLKVIHPKPVTSVPSVP